MYEGLRIDSGRRFDPAHFHQADLPSVETVMWVFTPTFFGNDMVSTVLVRKSGQPSNVKTVKNKTKINADDNLATEEFALAA